MSPIVVALLLAAPASDASVQAYVAAWRGDLAEARTLVTAALARDHGDGAALLVAACVELEEGHLDAAAAQVSRLASLEPRPPEAEVLRLLVERRRADTFERMADALAEAWKSAGRPDLGRAGLLRQVREAVPRNLVAMAPIEPGELRRRPPADALLLSALASPLRGNGHGASSVSDLLDAHQRWMAAQGERALLLDGAPDAIPLALSLCAYRWLDDPAARRRLGAALARAMPDNGAPELALALDGTGEGSPLSGPELDAIDAAAARPAFAWPYPQLLAELVRALRPLDAAHAALRARELVGWCAPVSLAPLTLARRAELTAEPALRARASAATDAVGRRLAEGGTLLDAMMGQVLQGTAARLRGDPGHAAMLEAAERWRRRLDEAAVMAALPTWPLPSTWRQWEPDGEVPFLSRLADAPRPP